MLFLLVTHQAQTVLGVGLTGAVTDFSEKVEGSLVVFSATWETRSPLDESKAMFGVGLALWLTDFLVKRKRFSIRQRGLPVVTPLPMHETKAVPGLGLAAAVVDPLEEGQCLFLVIPGCLEASALPMDDALAVQHVGLTAAVIGVTSAAACVIVHDPGIGVLAGGDALTA